MRTTHPAAWGKQVFGYGIFFSTNQWIDFGCCPYDYLVEDTETYLVCEGVVCDGACGGVDAQQPPHIDDPVRWNPLHQRRQIWSKIMNTTRAGYTVNL